ncbi:sulfatase [Chlamydiota bacterium]
MKSKPNIILLILDTARAQNFSCYGYSKETSINIDRISQEGILFENAISSSPWTLPAHASIFTGMYPSIHGCNETHTFLPKNVLTLPVFLKTLGYKTYGVSSNSWISNDFGFENGFDVFIRVWQLLQHETNLAHPSYRGVNKYKRAIGLLNQGNITTNIINGIYGKYFSRKYDYGAKRINRILARLIRNDFRQNQPFFLFVNYLEPHLKYKPPDPFIRQFLPKGISKRAALTVNQDAWRYMGGEISMSLLDFEILKALYDAEIAYLDFRIGEVYRLLKESKLLDNTVLIITSDHGENLGEYNLMDHQYSLYDTLLKIPLILKLPGVQMRGERVTHVVESMDIFSTIINVLEIDKKYMTSKIPGKNLFEKEVNRTVLSEYLAPHPDISTISKLYPNSKFSLYDKNLIALRTNEWKIIVSSSGETKLFNIHTDSHEKKDLSSTFPEVCKRLEKKVLEWKKNNWLRDNSKETLNISPETKKQLEALGYFM